MAAPVNPADGDFITRGVWIREVTDRWTELRAPWASYSPVWTASSGVPGVGTGTGSLTGSYKNLGSIVCLRLRLLLGTSPSLGTGAWSFTLPPDFPPIGTQQTITGWVSNAGGSVRHPISAQLTSANGVERMGVDNNILGATVPISWTAGDQLVLGGEYEWA